MGKLNLPIYTNRQQFLDGEYKETFSRIFKTQEQFERVMQEYAKQCMKCSAFYWEIKRCDCDYTHKNDNHAKETR